jgi:hypothetical protein
MEKLADPGSWTSLDFLGAGRSMAFKELDAMGRGKRSLLLAPMGGGTREGMKQRAR